MRKPNTFPLGDAEWSLLVNLRKATTTQEVDNLVATNEDIAWTLKKHAMLSLTANILNPETTDQFFESAQATPVPFKYWCEQNGRLWTGGNFARNYRDYEIYLHDLGAIELPTMKC